MENQQCPLLKEENNQYFCTFIPEEHLLISDQKIFVKSTCGMCKNYWVDGHPKYNIAIESIDTKNRFRTIDQIAKYAEAAAKHIAAACPKIADNDYQERLQICQQCQYHYNNSCVLCGCSCNGTSAFTNKLMMPTESCPINKWQAIK